MGCTPSVLPPQDIVGTTLHLPNSKLRFTLKQLRNLNKKLVKLAENERREPISEDTEIIAEKLVQRIVHGAAEKDARFKSKNIINLHKGRMLKSHLLEYLVVLECIQDKCAMAEGPPGCARIQPNHSETWEEFLSPNGYLRRDKVIERWVELLAWAAGSDNEVPGGAPGLVLSPTTFQRLCKLPLEHQCYYADADDHKSRTISQEYRIAIMEGTPWVRVRIAGGRLGEHGVEAKLALGIPFVGWPAGSDFPGRIPLGHPDALLFYKAAQSGFFVVGGAPALGVQWSERCAGWQIWPAAFYALIGSRGDGVEKVANILSAILQHLRDSGQPPLRVVSRFMIEDVLLWRLETPAAKGLASDLRTWSSAHMAHQVLCVLDCLLGQLGIKTGRHYLWAGCDVVKLSVWKGARIGDRDWKGDAACILNFLNKLQNEANNFEDENDVMWSRHSRLETALIGRWSQLLHEMSPAGNTRGGRLSGSGAAPYSPRQLTYFATVARNLLTTRQNTIQDSGEWFQGGLSTTITHLLDPIEDLIHLLAIILDQARDYYLKNHLPQGLFKESGGNLSNSDKVQSSKNTLKKNKLKNCYDASAAFLIDSVRRDMDTQKEDLTDDLILVRTLLKWLYKAVDDDKKYLNPVLRPYLELLFNSSHENCWHLDEFNNRISDKEMNALVCFCKLVNDKHISPAEGLVDAASKGWVWAENMLEMLDIASDAGTVLRLVFPKSNGQPLTFDLSLPSDARERDKWNQFLSNRKDRLTSKLKLAEKCVEEAFIYSLENDDIGFENVVSMCKSEEILSNTNVDINANAETISKSQTLRSNTGTIDTMTTLDSSKYHTLRSISSKYNTLKNSENLFGNYWLTGETLKMKHANSRPTILEDRNGNWETIDISYIGEDDDAESSLHCCLRDTSPFTLVLEPREQLAPHREYKGIVKALINMQRYSILQELCAWIPGREERTGALKALQRLARGGRRASGPLPRVQTSSHRNHYTISPRRSQPESKVRASIRQFYRQRNIDISSEDEARNKNKHILSASESTETECTLSSSKETEDRLDLEVQKECLQNLYIHDLPLQDQALTEHYLNLCQEAIRNSTSQNSLAVMEYNKEKQRNKKDRTRSSSEGRNLKESKLHRSQHVDQTQTLGRNVLPKDLKFSSDSLLGSCREARLHHAARRSVLPDNGPFGDAFEVTQIQRVGYFDYNTMTQSILQAAISPPGRDRQRRLQIATASKNNNEIL